MWKILGDRDMIVYKSVMYAPHQSSQAKLFYLSPYSWVLSVVQIIAYCSFKDLLVVSAGKSSWGGLVIITL